MKDKAPFKRLWHLVRAERHDIISIYFYAVLAGVLQLSVPIGVQAIIGFVLGAAMVTSIYLLIILVTLGVLITGVLQINQMKINERIQQKIFVQFGLEFADKIPKINLYKSVTYYLPEKVNRFFDTLSVQKGLTKILLDIPSAIIQILLGLLLLAFYHPMFIACGVLLVSTLWLIVKYSSANGLHTSVEESQHKDSVVAWFQEIAKAIKPFKNSQDASINLERTDSRLVKYISSRTAHFKILVFQYKTLVAFKVLITATLLTSGVYLLINQELNIGEFIAAEIVILMIIASTEKIIKNLDSVYDVVTGLVKIATLTESPLDEEGDISYNDDKIALEVKDLSFAFEENSQVLSRINAKIPSGSLVCVTGPEGSGKSTLLRILANLYTDYQGNVLANNIPMHNYTLEGLRRKMGIYFGRDDIFTGTVLQNITMGRKEVRGAQVMEMAAQAGIANFLENLPMGFQTPIFNSGTTLPNTTRHEILILRALCHHPQLIVMEDPFLGLREAVKKPFMDYLLGQKGQRTIIVVTNDQTFAQGCDYHWKLSNGSAELISYAKI